VGKANKRFVVVSGLPGSGKSTLARRLAAPLNLPVIDKDEILEKLFESKGAGDAAFSKLIRRRALSRESDAMFQDLATVSEGALLVSFWRVPGMTPDSGTPTGWLSGLSDHVINLHCFCAPEVAAARFMQRTRHPGHLDAGLSEAEVVESIRATARLGTPDIVPRIQVDTSGEPDLDAVVREILRAFDE
jgi:predicted kinase